VQFLSLLIPVFIVATSYAACARLSGWLLGRVRVRWQHGYAYFALTAAISLALRLLTGAGRVLPLPLPVALAIGLATQVAVGGLFFGARATGPDDKPIGARRALVLSALASAFLMLVLAGLLLMARALGPAGSVGFP
jgi:formate hydrogenlyase subunit 4